MTDFAKLHAYWTDAFRLYLRLITRAEATRRGVPHFPKGAPELVELHAAALWVHWRYEGRHDPKPLWMPGPHKTWAYVVYNEFNAAHPHGKPPVPPPPDPPHREKTPLWLDEPATSVSWGLQAEEGRGFNALPSDPAACAAALASFGLKRASLEAIADNEPHAVQFRDALHESGMSFDVWVNAPQEASDDDKLRVLLDRFEEWQPDSCKINWEFRCTLGGTDTTWQDIGTVNNCHHAFVDAYLARFPKVPFCPQTNYGGFEKREKGGAVTGYDQNAAKIWIAAGARCCQFEAYIGNGANMTPDEGDFGAINQLGFPAASTLTGPFPSETGRTRPDGSRYQPTIAEYAPLMAAAGRKSMQDSWTAEYMTREDLVRQGQPV